MNKEDEDHHHHHHHHHQEENWRRQRGEVGDCLLLQSSGQTRARARRPINRQSMKMRKKTRAALTITWIMLLLGLTEGCACCSQRKLVRLRSIESACRAVFWQSVAPSLPFCHFFGRHRQCERHHAWSCQPNLCLFVCPSLFPFSLL